MSYSKVQPFDNTAAANTAVVITVPAVNDMKRIVRQIHWSFDGAPTSSLKIESDGSTIFDIDVTQEGVGSVDFGTPGIPGSEGNTMVITLAAAGAGVTGKLNVLADES